jgi:hypothetical protein
VIQENLEALKQRVGLAARIRTVEALTEELVKNINDFDFGQRRRVLLGKELKLPTQHFHVAVDRWPGELSPGARCLALFDPATLARHGLKDDLVMSKSSCEGMGSPEG